MSNTISMYKLVLDKLGLDPGHAPAITRRTANILRNYQRAIDHGYMDRNTALERCLGDLAGRNYKADLEQRGEVRL